VGTGLNDKREIVIQIFLDQDQDSKSLFTSSGLGLLRWELKTELLISSVFYVTIRRSDETEKIEEKTTIILTDTGLAGWRTEISMGENLVGREFKGKKGSHKRFPLSVPGRKDPPTVGLARGGDPLQKGEKS